LSARSFTLAGANGRAVLLLHGLTGAPAEMHPLGRLLNRRGFTVHAPLLAGHGGGSRRILETGWRAWMASAEAAYDRLVRDHERVYAGGICLGAMLAVALAARRPVAAAAAYGTTFRYDGWTMPRAASNRLLIKLAAGLPGIRNIGFSEREPYGLKDEGIRAFVVRSQRKANGGKLDTFPLGAVRQLYLLADHVDRIAPSVTTPTLILHARQDDTSSPENARRLQSRLGGSARVELLDDSYHMIHLDREMARVATLTAAFFNEVEADVLRRA
jgi:carboxylesterase